jgi:hypothetical protein
VAGLDLAFLFILNLIVGRPFVADAKVQSLIWSTALLERGFIEDVYWGFQDKSLPKVQAPMTIN